MDPGDLYGLPLERFTEERNALAKQLRRDGNREEAAAVSKLRKPSVAAWAVNELVRTQSTEFGALLKSGDALLVAQKALLAGRSDPPAFRRAVESERAAVQRLAQRASGLLTSNGHELKPSKLERVAETLHAAALDQEARARVREACLERELRHIGLGALAEGTPGRRAARTAARQEEAEARRSLDRATREVAAAERQCRRAERELREAEEALATAREVRREAARQHEQASRALRDL